MPTKKRKAKTEDLYAIINTFGINRKSGKPSLRGAAKLKTASASPKKKTAKRAPANSGIAGTKRKKRKKSA